MLLDDAKTPDCGNPYKSQVLAAMASGVSIEVRPDHNLIDERRPDPGIKVNTGANLRIIELVQKGYVQIQP
jgi:hypothetical protein